MHVVPSTLRSLTSGVRNTAVAATTATTAASLPQQTPRQANKKAGRFNPDANIKDAILDAGRLGQKNGKGYYDYADGRTATPSAEVDAMIAAMAQKKGVPARDCGCPKNAA